MNIRDGRYVYVKKYITYEYKLKCYRKLPGDGGLDPCGVRNEIKDNPSGYHNDVPADYRYGKPRRYQPIHGEEDERCRN